MRIDKATWVQAFDNALGYSNSVTAAVMALGNILQSEHGGLTEYELESLTNSESDAYLKYFSKLLADYKGDEDFWGPTDIATAFFLEPLSQKTHLLIVDEPMPSLWAVKRIARDSSPLKRFVGVEGYRGTSKRNPKHYMKGS